MRPAHSPQSHPRRSTWAPGRPASPPSIRWRVPQVSCRYHRAADRSGTRAARMSSIGEGTGRSFYLQAVPDVSGHSATPSRNSEVGNGFERPPSTTSEKRFKCTRVNGLKIESSTLRERSSAFQEPSDDTSGTPASVLREQYVDTPGTRGVAIVVRFPLLTVMSDAPNLLTPDINPLTRDDAQDWSFRGVAGTPPASFIDWLSYPKGRAPSLWEGLGGAGQGIAISSRRGALPPNLTRPSPDIKPGPKRQPRCRRSTTRIAWFP
jgi:hypothetical protein